jgi:hypothetical protein
MASKSIGEALRGFIYSWTMPPSSNDTSTNNTSGICWIFQLPPEILQTITEYLNIRDIISLSRTCRAFNTLINNDNFWIHRIRCHFPPSIAYLYTFDLFQEPEYIETNDEPRPSGFDNGRSEGELDRLARKSATHYNDEAIERRHEKMYVSKEDFLKHLQYFQFNKPTNYLQIPLMKLIYFYMIDRKRKAIVDMDVVHRNDHYLVEQNDEESLKGRIIHLQSVCWLEITGRFEHKIMPGKYEVIWRMKCRGNDVRIWGETEFIVVPSHGKLLIHKISENDFRTYALQNGNQWFLVNMGQVIIYEPSTVLMGIRNWSNGNWKSGISWDCIELKLVP